MNARDLLNLKILLRLRHIGFIETDTRDAHLIVERVFVDQSSDLALKSPLGPLVELGLVNCSSLPSGAWRWTVSPDGHATIRAALQSIEANRGWITVDDCKLCQSRAWFEPD